MTTVPILFEIRIDGSIRLQCPLGPEWQGARRHDRHARRELTINPLGHGFVSGEEITSGRARNGTELDPDANPMWEGGLDMAVAGLVWLAEGGEPPAFARWLERSTVQPRERIKSAFEKGGEDPDAILAALTEAGIRFDPGFADDLREVLSDEPPQTADDDPAEWDHGQLLREVNCLRAEVARLQGRLDRIGRVGENGEDLVHALLVAKETVAEQDAEVARLTKELSELRSFDVVVGHVRKSLATVTEERDDLQSRLARTETAYSKAAEDRSRWMALHQGAVDKQIQIIKERDAAAAEREHERGLVRELRLRIETANAQNDSIQEILAAVRAERNDLRHKAHELILDDNDATAAWDFVRYVRGSLIEYNALRYGGAAAPESEESKP